MTMYRLLGEYSNIENLAYDQSFHRDDRKDFQACREMFCTGKFQPLINKLNHMDTYTREAWVVALADDVGKEFVENSLGWSL
jgi:hypothetical protein